MTKLLLLLLSAGAICAAENRQDLASLRRAVAFHAPFDGKADASHGKGDQRIYHAPNMNQRRSGQAGLPPSGVVALAQNQGKFGDALHFKKKSSEMVFFKAQDNLPFAKSGWNGTVSFWLRLDPDRDLEPGYCDPIQITPREWNDAALWVDFSKDERPRHFRLGAFADRSVWDPNKRDFEKIPLSERPMVTVTKPPFIRERWTHVLFSFKDFNTGKANGEAALYLDAKLQGTVSAREQTFSWNPAETVAMLGLSYTGYFDELTFFDRALTPREIEEVYNLPKGISGLLGR